MQTKLLYRSKTLLTIIMLVIMGVTTFNKASMAADTLSTPTNDKVLVAQIDQMLTAIFKADEPGAAVIVMRDDKPILRKGYGMANLELGVPLAPEMVFRLGSVTKQFTAVALLMLVEADKVELSDEITRYLPDYPTHGQRITVEHLLTHTSGIKNFVDLPTWHDLRRKDLTPSELIALFADEPLDFPPGTQWSYSNSGYVLLGAIIEKVAGMSYESFIQQHIFTPLGMTHSGYDHTERLLPGRVAGYVRSAEGFQNAQYLSMSHPYAAGALVSSIDDLAKWDAALYTDKLVKQRTLQCAFHDFTLNNGAAAGYGYGFEVAKYEGHQFLKHGGQIDGFLAWTFRLPDDNLYIGVLTNCENCPVALKELVFTIATMVIGKPYHDPTAISLPSSTLATYEGIYQTFDQSELIIRRDGDHLSAQFSNAPLLVLVPFSPTEFFIKDTKLRIKFVKSTTGQVTGVQVQERFGPWSIGQKTDKPLPVLR